MGVKERAREKDITKERDKSGGARSESSEVDVTQLPLLSAPAGAPASTTGEEHVGILARFVLSKGVRSRYEGW